MSTTATTQKDKDNKVPPPANGAKAATPAATKNATADATEEAKVRNSRKVYIVVGEAHEFKNAAEAEKFINVPGAPEKFSVIKGNMVVRKQKISLR